MLIFITSTAYRVLDKLLPYLPKSPENLKVAFIPTAADLYAEKPWVESDRNKLIELGFKVDDVDIKNFSPKDLKKKLSGYDIVFVTGGTTTYLLNVVRKSGFDEIIKSLVEKGVVYIGSSAGSVLVGPTVEVDRLYDHRNLGMELNSYEGIGLIDFVPLPHAGLEKYKEIIERITDKFGNKYTLEKLKDNQAFLIKDGEKIKIEVSE
jgi:dipeptidase E